MSEVTLTLTEAEAWEVLRAMLRSGTGLLRAKDRVSSPAAREFYESQLAHCNDVTVALSRVLL